MLHNLNSTTEQVLAQAPKSVRKFIEDRIDADTAMNAGVGALHDQVMERVSSIENIKREINHLLRSTPRADESRVDEQRKKLELKQEELKRYRASQAAANDKWSASQRLTDRLISWLREQNLSNLKVVEPKLKKGDTIESVRAEIERLDLDAEHVRRAPRNRTALIREISASVDAIAEQGAPGIDPRIRDRDPTDLSNLLSMQLNGDSFIGDGGTAFFAWLMKDEIKARLVELVPADGPDVLTDEQRLSSLTQIGVERLRLEYVEERLIRRAEAEDRVVVRREEASACAILQVEVS
ncbi:hypothetical protein [Cucumibacter marinus]|uniref:hypothetical protein n=1 Tax=Cucumibacter marinus TaxID=1121252 RepID=UPI0004235871|nr:hypothetical protein [Cucumibacter marinus]